MKHLISFFFFAILATSCQHKYEIKYSRGPSAVSFETYPVYTDLKQASDDKIRKGLCENISFGFKREENAFIIQEGDKTYTLQTRSTSGFKIESKAYKDKLMIISQKLPIYYETTKYRNCKEDCHRYNKKTTIMIHPRPHSGREGIKGFVITNYQGSKIVQSTTCGLEYKRT